MTNFIPSEDLAHFPSSLESGADAFTRSMLLKRLLREAEKPRLTRQHWTKYIATSQNLDS